MDHLALKQIQKHHGCCIGQCCKLFQVFQALVHGEIVTEILVQNKAAGEMTSNLAISKFCDGSKLRLIWQQLRGPGKFSVL